MILIVGYGNPLRGDDALGAVAAAHLARHFSDAPGVEVREVHQLTPELAETLAAFDRVIFVDAAHGGAAGELFVEEVQEGRGASSPFSHYVTPGELLALVRALYGASPRMVLTGVQGATFEVGQPLSDVVRQALPSLVERIVQLAAE